MRPLRLLIDGFGSYREATDVDLSDVDFFVLTGPTGSGKSTVIDALCFALYGTVPRWGKTNSIRSALAPSTAECRVLLVFEAAGQRYAAARQLRRDARGQVQTKEARLDRLDPSVPANADLAKVLEAVVESVAEGPDPVREHVTSLLGIGYEHFTQCVLLPQGRFAEFLHAKPSDRQNLLIELLAYGVYEEVGKKARERAKLTLDRRQQAERRLAEIGAVTEDELAQAQQRVRTLGELVPRVEAAVTETDELRGRWKEANEQAGLARKQVDDLAALSMPAGTAELAEKLAQADELVRVRTVARDEADLAETAAEQAVTGPDRAELLRWRDAYARQQSLRENLESLVAQRDAADKAERDATAAVTAAEQALAEAQAAVTTTEREHRAVTLAADLHEGEPCPVCLQQVHELPHHDVPADLDRTRAAVKTATAELDSARKRAVKAGRGSADAAARVASTEHALTELVAVLTGAPEPAEMEKSIAARDAADAAMARAREAARAAQRALDAAMSERVSLQDKEKAAWSELRAGRDRFVALHAPAVDGPDLATAWQSLLDWAGEQRAALTATAAELSAAETALKQQGVDAAGALTGLLAEHGVRAANVKDAPVALAAATKDAERDLADLLRRGKESARLTEEVTRYRGEAEVADMLGNLLRSNNFERWLCAEALDSLVLEASHTLLQLSGGQFELHRGERNELVVVDHNDAGTIRPVNTLSGGETFQASLALALALSRQVVGLSGGKRDLNSMFLDEGFGTLDESTLDVVASTLERLATESGRVVGIVTHVPALAERVPVQFAVSRDGATSRLRRVEAG
ncbi:AAA family ATPase [Labedaea rhizosphaerae]|uniref:Nuclease SbcCD subunit C n=1 Tax=Labedaea rhizosphaerae TaxID=598644 RepID=A0A4R6SI42_LABRH|nr:SMC family ATPase [Labedaea rhizosphaerae]TDQ01495.1 exonuclease SbcC [Labedaea rhizosphaerae]